MLYGFCPVSVASNKQALHSEIFASIRLMMVYVKISDILWVAHHVFGTIGGAFKPVLAVTRCRAMTCRSVTFVACLLHTVVSRR